ncbi:glycan-binding surface protein [uncultured Mucilaginibacter sp.]|uniref:glycan-binding surface protein n=1 Tax=uncultured Mucilaginibacter sp. TaxID=797541 RepID=UPI0025F35575|nr:glycan-binding surface protein [uncultured Mucilaginibacter sp.]
MKKALSLTGMMLGGLAMGFAQSSSFTLTKMLNEYAPVGSNMVIIGSQLKSNVVPGKAKVLFGSTEAAIVRLTDDSLYVKVPENAQSGNTIKVLAGGTEKTVPYQYKDKRNMIFDFESGSVSEFTTKSSKPGAIDGKYIRVEKEIPSWSVIDFVQGNVPLPADVVKNPENYVFKFEVNTLKPFDANMIKFMIDGDYHEVNTYLWKSRQTFDTRGQWQTFSIDLGKMINTPLKESSAKHKVKFSYHGNGILDADMSFDNFRIVPKED